MQDYLNRLTRMYRHYRKWASRSQISCFRIYDCDVPSHPFIVDVYEDHLHMAEVERKGRPPMEDSERQELVEQTAQALGFDPARIFLKARRRQSGNNQYDRLSEDSATLVVRENRLKFELNLSDYLDTGLFLDHRNARRFVMQGARDLRVLNLFCYTGSFTVHAAAGGAFSTQSLDLSATYLEWARRNLELNGLEDPLRHKFIRRDALEFLKSESGPRYDLIIMDPPTFSNSKKMAGTLDTQRDHSWMVPRAMGLLNSGGYLLFSTNFRKFQLDPALEKSYGLREISHLTIPPDFRKSAHRSFLFQKEASRGKLALPSWISG